MLKTVLEPIWDNDLIMCPSQCYCYFEADGQKYCIYLRWRWDDPWTAQLVPVMQDGEFYSGPWEYLDVPDYIHDGYENLQKLCLRMISERFNNICWLQKPVVWYKVNC